MDGNPADPAWSSLPNINDRKVSRKPTFSLFSCQLIAPALVEPVPPPSFTNAPLLQGHANGLSPRFIHLPIHPSLLVFFLNRIHMLRMNQPNNSRSLIILVILTDMLPLSKPFYEPYIKYSSHLNSKHKTINSRHWDLPLHHALRILKERNVQVAVDEIWSVFPFFFFDSLLFLVEFLRALLNSLMVALGDSLRGRLRSRTLTLGIQRSDVKKATHTHMHIYTYI